MARFPADLVLRRGVSASSSLSSIFTSSLSSDSIYVTAPRFRDDVRTPVDVDATDGRVDDEATGGPEGGAISV